VCKRVIDVATVKTRMWRACARVFVDSPTRMERAPGEEVEDTT